MTSTIINKDRFCKALKRAIQYCLIVCLLPAILLACGTTSHLVDNSYMQDFRVADIDSRDPSQPGPYEYKTFFYGKGDDQHRNEYGDQVDFKTNPVDARPFIKGISQNKLDERKHYWGFGFDQLPLNGRVWFPDGKGPFPLIFIVHGNHDMKDFSDPGYAYLGELFASRGFITVSVDENFLNGDIRSENDARAFVLLEHLKVWRRWNKTEGHAFEGKVNMDRIALIGHSRGGESVAHAAAFNRLSHYPDDANVTFDYNFSIRSITAIAPADGQYKPAGHLTPLENINYLVIHGGHDADVVIFMGIRQFTRVRFTDNNFWFKSAVYIYQANHSRFNTSWGRLDHSEPKSWLINEKPIMEMEKQRRVAKTILSAFLETTINGKAEYLPIFQNIRNAAAWLPEDIYVNQYQDSNFKVIANFEEDIDVTTPSISGGKLSGQNLVVWKEAHVPFRLKVKPSIVKTTVENSTVILGWNNTDPEKPVLKEDGSYAIALSQKTCEDLGLNRSAKLIFSIGATEKAPSQPLDLSLELRDREGNHARLPLSSVGPIHPPLDVRIAKWKWLEKKYFSVFSERILQTFEIPLSQFSKANPAFDPCKLKSIRFVFDRSLKGEIMLDDIGIAS
jgi:dienelactone hydrolase